MNLLHRIARIVCLGQMAAVLCCHGAETHLLEAEDGTLFGITVTSQTGGFSGTGYVTGFNLETDKVRWEFMAEPGFYDLVIGFRTPSGEKGFAGYLNGIGLTGHFPASSSFSEYRIGRIYLKQGLNQLEIGGGWSWYEIDYARLTRMDPPAPPLPVTTALVNAQASSRAVQLMRYLQQEYGKNTLSGQFQLNEAAIIKNTAGVSPAILNGDLIDYSPTRIQFGANPDGYTESMIAAAQNGYILSLTWHWNAPTHLINSAENPWWSGFYTRATTFNIEQTLAQPESEEYQLLLRDLDAISVELKKLQAADLPILWRPLHEPEGAWFWWGARGAQPFKELWRLMYDRFTNYHGLNNLIWVLASEDPDWYPGDDVVDIVGVDAYPQDRSDPLISRWESLINRFDGKKLLALTEFGGVPVIPAMQFLGVWWSYFASWTGDLGPASMEPSELQRIYTSADVVTLDELPYFIVNSDWNGYPITSGNWIDTQDYMGWIHVAMNPYLYSQELEGWIFIKDDWMTPSGAWVYIFKQ